MKQGCISAKQNGAPVRLVVPWKYGFKSIKSIVSIRFSRTAPKNTWQLLAPQEYGFYANVNPDVAHPRWSQATERVIPNMDRRPTLLYNGYEDWVGMSKEEYEHSKQDLVETTIDALEKYIPGVRAKIDRAEAATPRTFNHYTQHEMGASFGTKFEGLGVSRELPKQIGGMYHAGSVGIIMSGWLGAINYGVIVANDVDAQLTPTSGVK